MTVTLRLAMRRLRLEILIFLVASVVVSAGTLAVANTFAHLGTAAPDASLMELVSYIRLVLVGLPVLAGVVIGTSLIATDLDQGATVFAWSVALRRLRWLAETAIVGVLIVLVISIPVAWSSRVLSAALGPQLDATTSPASIDPSALLLSTRCVVALSVACLVGIVLGRALPTLLTSLLVSLLVIGAFEVGFGLTRDAQITPIDSSTPGSLYVGTRLEAPDGRLLTVDEAAAGSSSLDSANFAAYKLVVVGLRPSARAVLVAEEIGALVASAAGALATTGIVIRNRRPT